MYKNEFRGSTSRCFEDTGFYVRLVDTQSLYPLVFTPLLPPWGFETQKATGVHRCAGFGSAGKLEHHHGQILSSDYVVGTVIGSQNEAYLFFGSSVGCWTRDRPAKHIQNTPIVKYTDCSVWFGIFVAFRRWCSSPHAEAIRGNNMLFGSKSRPDIL